MSTMTLRLDDDTQARLDALAKSTDRSKAWLATEALRSYLDNNEWQIGAIREAVEAADRARADEFVDHQAVSDWLESWGSEDEKDAPE